MWQRLSIILAYLAITLVIGVIFRKQASANKVEFFLAGRGVGRLLLFFTMAATNFSAFTIFGLSGAGYRIGYAFYPVMGFGTGFMALSFLLIGRPILSLSKERGYITPSDFIADRYAAPWLKKLFSAVMIVFTLPYIAIQAIDIRAGQVQMDEIELWNERHDPYFDPNNEEYIVHLTTTNKMAEVRNNIELNKLEGELWELKAKTQGELGTRKMPSEAKIRVKEGVRIMFTTNDPQKRFVNGSLGTITRICKQGMAKLPTLEVVLDSGETVEVSQHKWEVFEYEFNGASFEEEIVGAYMQYPITLAWAVTIHKAQGKTFDRILVDTGWGAFAHGQMYVALSRCTKFKNITLLKPFQVKDVIVDQIVLDFMEGGMAKINNRLF